MVLCWQRRLTCLFIMEQKNSAIIEENLENLTKLTKNFEDVLEKLQDYDVLTSSELYHINCCSDEETSISLLYSIVGRKPLSNFDLLLYVLKDTDNELLAKLLEKALKAGEPLDFPVTPLTTSKCDKRYNNEATSVTLISGGEMGIAELLDEYPQLSGNWKQLFRMLHLPNSCLNSYKYEDNFVIQATLILRDWCFHLKKRATVENLCGILEKEGHHRCSARIRRMFDKYVDSGFAFDFPGSFTRKITIISSILDNNPSFCFHPERLFLMLNLPLESLSGFVRDTSFPQLAEEMLTRWAAEKPAIASTDHLASLLAINGHFHTCDNVSSL